MNLLSGATLLLCAHTLALLPTPGQQASLPQSQSSAQPPAQPLPSPAPQAPWSADKVQHAYGLPEIKPDARGTLLVDSTGLTFRTASGNSYTIPRAALVAAETDSERVELWGMKGRILRMAIPQGGGLAAAGFLHHKVNMLSVEFTDTRSAYHAAVFYLPAPQAGQALTRLSALTPPAHPAAPPSLAAGPSACTGAGAPEGVLLAMPLWNQSNVPAAYRDLVYEHTIDRLQQAKHIGHVYREGELGHASGCPRYTIHVSVSAFRAGNQVQRAMTGPVGMFMGTTQMVFTVDIVDATHTLHSSSQMKATVRGDGESRNVAQNVAKAIAKRYRSEIEKFEKTQPAVPAAVSSL